MANPPEPASEAGPSKGETRVRVEYVVASGKRRTFDERRYATAEAAVRQRDIRRTSDAWARYGPHYAFERTITERDITEASDAR